MTKPKIELVGGGETSPHIQPNPPTGNPTPKQTRENDAWPSDPLVIAQRQVKIALALATVALMAVGGLGAWLFQTVQTTQKIQVGVDSRIKDAVRHGLEAERKNAQTQIQEAIAASEKATAGAIDTAKKELTTVHQADIQAVMGRLDQIEKARTLASQKPPKKPAKKRKRK